jgi:hypothetical protein
VASLHESLEKVNTSETRNMTTPEAGDRNPTNFRKPVQVERVWVFQSLDSKRPDQMLPPAGSDTLSPAEKRRENGQDMHFPARAYL